MANLITVSINLVRIDSMSPNNNYPLKVLRIIFCLIFQIVLYRKKHLQRIKT